jgi:hypothetical protein
MSLNQVVLKPAVILKDFSGHFSTIYRGLKKCVGNCGVVERALYEGLQGGLYCLWKAIEMVLLYISFGIDNLDI